MTADLPCKMLLSGRSQGENGGRVSRTGGRHAEGAECSIDLIHAASPLKLFPCC